MTDAELDNALNERQALVVHLSHHANMRAGGEFPSDLQQAIQNRTAWPLSCVVIWPNHGMDLPGSVGVIFHPRIENILSVSNSDSGSSVALDGTDVSAGLGLTWDTLKWSLNVMGAYNEWRIQGATPIGIFVSDPGLIQAKRKQVFSAGSHQFEDIALSSIALDEVFEAFPDLPIYTMGPMGAIKLRS